MLTVLQALEILKQYDITDSEQMIRRWLREGRIKGNRSANRKEGWQILNAELNRFIEEVKPAIRYEQEIEKLKKRVAQLERKNKELQEQLNNITYSNIKTINNITKSNIKELTRSEVEQIWQEAIRKLNEMPKILEDTYKSLIGGLFKEGNTTNLYNSSYKRPYVCPFTNKKYSSPESLIKAAVQWLIKSAQAKQKRQQEKEHWWAIEETE